jgi:protein FAM50
LSKYSASTPQPAKKKRKAVKKGKLSFGVDDDDEDNARSQSGTPLLSRGNTPGLASGSADLSDVDSDTSTFKRKLGPNSRLGFVPKAKTKNALLKEAQTREQLRKEFLAMQTAVKATEMVLPFVFYDGTNIPGGKCRLKKGDQIWLFLDRARKLGAELGVGGSGTAGETKARGGWARVSVDDLMLVRHDVILPHHYDFYQFMLNKTRVYEGQRLFEHSAEPTAASPNTSLADESVDLALYDPMAKQQSSKTSTGTHIPDEELEGFDDDPIATKVVDRRWYERNKHIYPASLWEDFDPGKDYTGATKKDGQGNAFFFS